jgi:hypothetical protein
VALADSILALCDAAIVVGRNIDLEKSHGFVQLRWLLY